MTENNVANNDVTCIKAQEIILSLKEKGMESDKIINLMYQFATNVEKLSKNKLKLSFIDGRMTVTGKTFKID